MLNLDTHMVLYAFMGTITARERRLLTGDSWSISAIVFWELAKLEQLGRLEIALDTAEVVRALSALQVWPIDLAVARASTRLDFRAGPADELIAATSVIHKLPLLTRDRAMRRSRMVPIAA